MPECESGTCSQQARHTVRYEDPGEEVGYCLAHALAKYRHESDAVAIEEGV